MLKFHWPGPHEITLGCMWPVNQNEFDTPAMDHRLISEVYFQFSIFIACDCDPQPSDMMTSSCYVTLISLEHSCDDTARMKQTVKAALDVAGL